MTLEDIRAFLGWCTVINMGLLIFSSVMLIFVRDMAYRVHGKLFKISVEQFNGICYSFLAFYKIGITIIALAPQM